VSHEDTKVTKKEKKRAFGVQENCFVTFVSSWRI